MAESITQILIPIFEASSQLDLLYKNKFGEILNDFSFSEMHCIDCIEKIENPNVTKLAVAMNLTKAGISKLIKKLIQKKSIEIYKNPDNKKEIYYKLTEIGYKVYESHLVLHKIWCEKDEEFFEKFSKKDLEVTVKVLTKYSKFLQSCLKSMKGDTNES